MGKFKSTQTIEERFLDKVIPVTESGCWLWSACLSNKGYGNFRIKGGTVLAHRMAYELFVGPVPDGLVLDHLCRVPACVNPKHLEPVTLVENIMRGVSPNAINARKTHCIRGHEFNKENTHIKPDGGRWCKACGRQKDKIRNAREKAERAARRVS